jgi:hypothetical protein
MCFNASDQVIGVVVVIVKSRGWSFLDTAKLFGSSYMPLTGGPFFYCEKRIQKKIIIIKAIPQKNKISVFLINYKKYFFK